MLIMCILNLQEGDIVYSIILVWEHRVLESLKSNWDRSRENSPSLQRNLFRIKILEDGWLLVPLHGSEGSLEMSQN